MSRSLAYLSLIATLLFGAAVVVLHFLAPDISPLRSGISFYALARYGVLLGLAVVLAGVAGIALAIALWPALRSTGGRIGLLLLAAWGITAILAGLFPLDAPGAPPTLSGSIHNLAGLNFLLILPALLLIELSRPAAGGEPRPRTASFWLAWLLLAAAVLLFTFNGPLYSLGIGGLIQRLYWLVLVLWLTLKAAQVVRMEAPAREPALPPA